MRSDSALELLTELRSRGIELWVDGDRIRYRAPTGVFAPALRERLQERRAEVLSLLRGIGQSARDRIDPVPRDGRALALSYAQERMWYLSQLEDGSNRYVEAEAFRVAGPVDLAALGAALEEILRRHESLRATFPTRDGRPAYVVQVAGPVPVPVLDLTGTPDGEQDGEVAEAIRREREQPFDLATGPLLRVLLVRLATERHVLVVTMHHILGDAWSRRVLSEELAVLYGAFARGEPSPLPALPVQFADYASWERERLSGDRLEALLEYWRGRLAGAPALRLPGERSGGWPAAVSSEHMVRIGPELTTSLRALSSEERVTPFMTLVAAFAVLLYRYTDQEDISLGTEVASRVRPETERLIGLLVNQLVLRVDLSGDPPFRTLLQRVREVTLAAFAHQELPFEKLVEDLQPDRQLGQQPLFRAGLSLDNVQPTPPSGAGVEIERIRLAYGALYDFFLFLTEEDDTIAGPLVCDPTRVDEEVVTRLLRNFETLLDSIVADPGRRVSELTLLSGAERRDVLERWNATADPGEDREPIHRRLERQAARTPDRVAVVHEGAHLTYAALDEAANRLAHSLLDRGLEPEQLVGIFLEPSIERVVGAYGILKAGGTIVFLDPRYPPGRLELMIRESGLTVLLADEAVSAIVPPTGVEQVRVDEVSRSPGQASHDPGVVVRPDQLLYAIFTSGSTGVPKCIGFTHRAFANLLAWQETQPGLAGPATTVQFSTFGFCVSFQEIFSTLSVGGRLALAPTEVRTEPDTLLALLRREEVRRLYLPFAALKLLAQAATATGTYPDGLHAVVTAGEQLQLTDGLRTLFDHLPGVTLHNQYGASETHVVTSHVLPGPPAGWPPIAPIGRPNRNNRIYVLDRRLQPVPVGAAGEVYVAGEGLPRGYLDDPELTAEKVVADPFGHLPGGRMYRTGDLAEWLPGGTLRHLGRLDHQVKVRGFRIELGEIEAALRRGPAVRDVAVTATGEDSTSRQIVAYVVLDDAPTATADLWAHVERELPGHMAPHAIVPLPALPVNTNGKLDLERLPEPDPDAHRRPSRAPFVAPRTPLEEQLAAVLAGVLGISEVGINDDFFQLGGHSLLATQAVFRIREALGVALPVRAIFEGPTVAELSVRLVEAQLEALGQDGREPEGAAAVEDPTLAVSDETLAARRARAAYDVVVVGARCAGAPAAMLLARQGYRVLLLERATFPRDTVSTHCVWQPGAAHLDRWGLLDRLVATGCPAIETVTTDYGDLPLTGTPPSVDGVTAAYAPLRTVLDPLLAEAAVEAGAELREGCTVRDLVFEDGVVTGVRLSIGGATAVERSGLVIGADGRHSVVARSVRAAEYDARPPLACYYYGYWSGVGTSAFTMYLRGRRMLVTFPTHHGLTVVLAGWPQEEFARLRRSAEAGFDEALRLVPELHERLAAGHRERPLVGVGPHPNFFRRSHGPGWALVGDAGHCKDPHSARGISDAFRDAELLAGAVDDGLSGRARLGAALAGYEARRNDLAVPLYESNYQASGLEAPSERQLAARAALRGDQAEIDRLLGVMTGAVRLDQLEALSDVS